MLHACVRPLVFLVTGLVMAVVPGCAKRTARSVLTISVQGRKVVATIDGPGWISSSPNGDAAIITFAGQEVVVEKERVIIDGKTLATVPADASKVDLTHCNGNLTITADGKDVLKPAP